MSARKFSGPLANPIVIDVAAPTPLEEADTLSGIATGIERERRHKKDELERVTREVREKLDLLFEEFGVKRTSDHEMNYYKLVMVMAFEFVPGLNLVSSQQKKGRPKVWTSYEYFNLYADVTEVMNRKGCSQSEACLILTKKKVYKSRWGGFKKGTLENRFIKAKDEEHNPLFYIISKSEAIKSKVNSPVSSVVEIFGITANPD